MTLGTGLWKQLENSFKQPAVPLTVDSIVEVMEALSNPEKARLKELRKKLLTELQTSYIFFTENEIQVISSMINSQDLESIELAEALIKNISKK